MSIASLFCTIILAAVSLDQSMTMEEQKNTGVSKLTPQQKAALENWIDRNYIAKAKRGQPQAPTISENINNGKLLRLTDGSLYEVAPADRVYTSLWITPFPMEFSPSGDPQYPVRITDKTSGTSVKARQIEPPRY